LNSFIKKNYKNVAVTTSVEKLAQQGPEPGPEQHSVMAPVIRVTYFYFIFSSTAYMQKPINILLQKKTKY
jgi:hypothetical protein